MDTGNRSRHTGRERLKILHVVRGLANSSGTTHIVVALSEHQATLGHQVSVCFADKGGEKAVVPQRLVSSHQFPTHVLRGNPGLSLPMAHWLRREIQDFDIVHVHAVWNFPTYYAMRTAERARVPYIVAPQGSLEPWALSSGSWRRRFYAEHVERPLLQKASCLQALSEAELAQFRGYGLRVPVAVIPNAVGQEWLRANRVNTAAELGLPCGTQTILFLSRLHPKKGLDILLQAFAAFCRERDGITLLVGGSDGGSGYEKVVRARARELGLGQRCLFLGEARGEYKKKLFAGADAFVLTSHSEGLPVAVLEAMASGTPVLVTPGCNLPEVESADAGIVVNPKWQAVLVGLREFFADSKTMHRRGENGRRLIRERFTWPRIARQTLAVYEAMIAENAGQVKEVA